MTKTKLPAVWSLPCEIIVVYDEERKPTITIDDMLDQVREQVTSKDITVSTWGVWPHLKVQIQADIREKNED
jgi:hypothetical protein